MRGRWAAVPLKWVGSPIWTRHSPNLGTAHAGGAPISTGASRSGHGTAVATVAAVVEASAAKRGALMSTPLYHRRPRHARRTALRVEIVGVVECRERFLGPKVFWVPRIGHSNTKSTPLSAKHRAA